MNGLMVPTKPENDLAYCALSDTKFTGEFILCDLSDSVDSPYVINFTRRKFAHSVPFSRSGSSLGGHIPLIVEHGSCEQMGRINAWWIVAHVQNFEPVWNRSIVNYPRRDMGIKIVAPGCGTENLTVPGFISTSRPYPTSISNLDFRPEPGQECSRKSL